MEQKKESAPQEDMSGQGAYDIPGLIFSAKECARENGVVYIDIEEPVDEADRKTHGIPEVIDSKGRPYVAGGSIGVWKSFPEGRKRFTGSIVDYAVVPAFERKIVLDDLRMNLELVDEKNVGDVGVTKHRVLTFKRKE